MRWGKDDSCISVHHFLWKPWPSRLGLCRCRVGRTRRTGDKDRRTWIETLQQHKRKGADLCMEGCSATGKGGKWWKVEGHWHICVSQHAPFSCRSITLYSPVNYCELLRLRNWLLNITGLNESSFLVPWWSFAAFLKSWCFACSYPTATFWQISLVETEICCVVNDVL